MRMTLFASGRPLDIDGLCGKKNIAVDIQAERVEIDQKVGRVLFIGGVKVSRGDLVLACERLVAHYQKNGTLALTMRGRLTVRGKEFSAQAENGRI